MSQKIGTAILELRTDTGQINTSLKAAVGQVREFGSQVNGIGTKIQGIFSVAQGAIGLLALGAVGKQVLDFAGHVVDMAGHLKVSTATVQEWEAAFGQSGISIETVAKASDTLTDKLIKGDKSAVGALEKVGLSVEKLKAMKPEDRFNTVADAVGNIKDAGEQLYASKTLFGKGGPELLAALDGHLSDTVQKIRDMGLVIDEETLRAADDFGDQLGLMGTQLLGIVATIIGPLLPALSALGNILSWLGRNVVGPVLGGAIKVAMTLLAGFVEVLADMLSRLASLGSKIPGVGGKFQGMADTLKDVSQKSGQYMADLWKQKDATDAAGNAAAGAKPKLLGLGGATDDSAKKAKKAAEEFARLATQIDLLNKANASGIVKAPDYNPAEGELPGLALFQRYSEAIANLKKQSPVTITVSVDAQSIEQSIAGSGSFGLESIGIPLENVIIEHGTSGFAEAVGAFPQILQNALTGGGGLSGAIQAMGSLVGSKLGEGLFKAGGLLNGVGNKLAGVFGDAFGLALPGIGAALGSLVGPALSKLWGGIKRAFGGPSQKELAGRDLEKTFEDSFGGFEKMMALLGDAGERAGHSREEIQRWVKSMLDAEKEGPEAVQAWIDKLSEVIDQADSAAAATKEGLAEAAAAAKAASTARMQAAESELQSLIDKRNELASGIAKEADEAVKGVIQQDQEAELARLDEQLKDKAEQYAALADETGQKMADAIVEALRNIHIDPIHVAVIADPSGFPSGGTTYGEAPEPGIPMAAGGFGRVYRPTRFIGGEAGAEDVVFGGAGRNLARDVAAELAPMLSVQGGGAPQTIQTTVNVDGKTLIQAAHRVYDRNTGGLRTEARQLLGVGA